MRAALQPLAGLAIAPDQVFQLRMLNIADRVESVLGQRLGKLRPHAVQEAGGLVRQEFFGLLGREHRKAAGLVEFAGGLGEELVGRQADRDRHAHLFFHLQRQARQARRRRQAVQTLGAGQVQIGLVDRHRLHQRRQRVHPRTDGPARLVILGKVRGHDHRVRAEFQRLEHRHGGAHAVKPRLVTAGRHNAPGAAAHDQGLVAQLRIVPFLDCRIKRVAIDMRDGENRQRRMTHDPQVEADRAPVKIFSLYSEAVAAKANHRVICTPRPCAAANLPPPRHKCVLTFDSITEKRGSASARIASNLEYHDQRAFPNSVGC